MDDKSIAVIIPTYNRKDCLREVLECLAKQSGFRSTLKIIVVVDGSSDGTTEMLRSEFPGVFIVTGTGDWWYTKCINEGLKKAIMLGADYILTLNDDVSFSENYVDSLLSTAKELPPQFLIGSCSFTQSVPYRVTFSGIKSLVKWRLKEINYMPKFTRVDPAGFTGLRPSVNLSGRGMFFPKNVVMTVGFYDENLKQYSSDTDFSYRAYLLGIGVYVSYDAKVFENEKLTSKGTLYNKVSFKEYWRSLFNEYSVNSLKKGFYYYRKHGSPVLFPVYVLFSVTASVLLYFVKYRKV